MSINPARRVLWFALLFIVSLRVHSQSAPADGRLHATRQLADLHTRDPFILPVAATKTYYLLTSMINRGGPGVSVFASKDLEHWRGPYSVFRVPTNFWSQAGAWAPEMHFYKGKYYLFVTFNTDDKLPTQENWGRTQVKRGSQILVADSPLGPFQPFQNHATLPADKMTLDGTLWVEDGVPYMVYCHEWVQIKDGAIEVTRLKDDLSGTVGEPTVLFRASAAPWCHAYNKIGARVTDGPYLYRTKTGKLLLIWSSFGKGGYTVGIAVSASGKLKGPWQQQAQPLFTEDGGHGMIFKKFDGTLMLVLHQPNKGDERPHLFELEDLGDTIRIKQGATTSPATKK